MKKLLSIILVCSLLLANIGFVKIGDDCCSKTTLAIVQPILSANCCCNTEVDALDKCCSQINSFVKLSTDFEKDASTDFTFKKYVNTSVVKLFYNSVNIVETACSNLQANNNFVAKPPGVEFISFYKLFSNYKLYA